MGKNGLIIVTGGAGFIGKNLVKELVNQGRIPYIIDDLSNSTMHDVHPTCINYNGNVKDIDKINPSKVEVIYHLAGQSRVQPSFDNPVGSVESNVNGTQAVLEYARKHECKVIYAGSSSKHQNIYDSPYSATKALGEQLCKLYKNVYNVNVEIARFYNVYGPGESLDPVNGNVIGIWRHLIEQGKRIQIVGDGGQKRDFTHVDDIVSGLIALGDSRERHIDGWELGTGINYSINELYDFFKTRYPKIKKRNILDQQGNYRQTLRINDDMHKRLGWLSKDRLKHYITNLK